MNRIAFTITFLGPFHVASGGSDDGADRTVDRVNPLPASSLKGVMRAAAERLQIPGRLVEQVFGGARPSPWTWSDARLTNPRRSLTSRIEMTADGVVAQGALLIGQHTWSDSATFAVELRDALDDATRDRHRLLLRAAAREITALGGGRRRGEGWVTIADEADWTIDDTIALLALDAGAPADDGPDLGGAATEVADPAGGAAPVVLDYRLVATQRVAAGTGASVGNEQPVHRVLPGATVRGALAAAWMREHGLTAADQAMADLFERDLLVRQAVPADAAFVAVSRQWCKYPKAGVHDRPDHVASADLAEHYLRTGEVPTFDFCGGPESGKGWATADVPVALTGHTQLSPEETANDGALYSVEGLERSVVLTGTLIVHDHDAVAWLEQTRALRIGGRRSTLGAVTWTATRQVSPDPGPAVGRQVMLRCLSPLIAVDEYGAPTTDITDALRRAFPDHHPVVDKSWTRTTIVGGWHMAANLPKPDDIAVAAGSVFVVSGLPGTASADLAAGLGLRRLEGFGQFEIVGRDDDPATPTPTARPPVPATAPTPGSVPAGPPDDAVITGEGSAPPADPLRDLRMLVPANRVDAVGTGLLDALRKIAGFQSSGMDGVAAGVAKSTLRQPWARDLPGPALNQLQVVLGTADAGKLRDRLQGGEWT